MILVEFTLKNDAAVLVNPDYVTAVVAIQPDKGTEIYLKNSDDPFIVVDSIKDVANWLRNP